MSYLEFQRASMFFDFKDYTAAGRILAPIVEREPANRAATELLGRAYFHSAQLGRAEETFLRLIEIDPANGWAYEALARTLERRNRAGEAGRYRRLAHAMGAELTEGIDAPVSAAGGA